jgi:hypothetical protein
MAWAGMWAAAIVLITMVARIVITLVFGHRPPHPGTPAGP